MGSNDGPINVSESNEDGVGGGCRWSMESSCDWGGRSNDQCCVGLGLGQYENVR